MPIDHPDITELLLWQSGEMATDRIAALEKHVSGCSECQAQLSEIDFLKENITEIHTAATQLNMQAALDERIRKPWFGGFLSSLAPSRTWLAATSSVLIAALLLYTFTDLTPAARAEALLSKAAEHESTSTEPRFLQFESGGSEYPFTVGGEARRVTGAASFPETVMADFRAAGWSSESPLSAKSFLHWRESLRHKRDTLHNVPGATEVTTSTEDGPIRRAMLRIRSSDHQPVAGAFEFSAEMHLPPVSIMEAKAPVEETAVAPVHESHGSERSMTAPAVAPSIDPLDRTEAAVRLELHKMNQDGNVLLAVGREPSEIKVWGAIPTEANKTQLSKALESLPQVQVAISARPQANQTETVSALPWQPYLGDTTPLGNDQLQALYPNDLNGRQEYLNNIDTLTRRLVGEARTRDGLVALAGRMRASGDAAGLHQAISDVQAEMLADMGQLRTKLQPLTGTIAGQPHPLSYAQAMQLYTLVHEVLFLGKSKERLTLDDALGQMRPLLAGR